MEIISIIPARGGSKGIPLKNIIPLNRKPLLYYTVTASLNSSSINITVVTTDHGKIARAAQRFGSEVVNRPKNLANDTIGLEPTLGYTLDYLEKKERYIPDVIVLLQNTSPLRSSKHIDEALELFFTKKYDSVLSGSLWPTFYGKLRANMLFP